MSDLNLTKGGKFFLIQTGIAIVMKELKINKKRAAWNKGNGTDAHNKLYTASYT
ncbi:hypothetical protein GGR08_001055 [Bartonella fuyuanensis]|uniref:Uncharacterized protein n=1 Tax=Bartonella fuyuanensis TaxID=1460968 RepID=A0A840E3M3_9HYPH|nr:hypothetical protein [Bartonella fuyuanensis]MBB4076748.1 hypothetical protein [Bartonella fuyuanensis]